MKLSLTKYPLEDQYTGFNICFWVMLVLACILSLTGNTLTAVAIGTLGLVSGAIGQLKLILMNQQLFLDNQMLFLANQNKVLEKLDKLLEGK